MPHPQLDEIDDLHGRVRVDDLLPKRFAMSDQEIRARALECAVRYGADPQDWMNFWDLTAKFEDYIRNGK